MSDREYVASDICPSTPGWRHRKTDSSQTRAVRRCPVVSIRSLACPTVEWCIGPGAGRPPTRSITWRSSRQQTGAGREAASLFPPRGAARLRLATRVHHHDALAASYALRNERRSTPGVRATRSSQIAMLRAPGRPPRRRCRRRRELGPAGRSFWEDVLPSEVRARALQDLDLHLLDAVLAAQPDALGPLVGASTRRSTSSAPTGPCSARCCRRPPRWHIPST